MSYSFLMGTLLGRVGAVAQYNPPATPAPDNPIALAEVTGAPRAAVQAGQKTIKPCRRPIPRGGSCGTTSTTPMALTLEEAVTRGLKQNLGGVLASDAVTDAQGAALAGVE